MPKKDAAPALKTFSGRLEAKSYLLYLKPLYDKAGIKLTEEKMNEILAHALDKNRALTKEEEYARTLLGMGESRSENLTKYHQAESRISQFDRIYTVMIKPGNDPETEQYNKRLQRLSQTPEGQMLIVLEAAEIISKLDKSLLFAKAPDDLKNYQNNFQAYNLMMIVRDVIQALNDVNKTNPVESHLIENLNYFRDEYQEPLSLSIKVNDLLNNPLHTLMPENTDYITAQKTLKDGHAHDRGKVRKTISENVEKFLSAGLQVTAEDAQRDQYRKDWEPKQKEWNKKLAIDAHLRTSGYQVSKFNDQGYIVLDEENNILKSNDALEYGKNYLAVNQFGEPRGFRFNDAIKIEKIDAKIPDFLTRKVDAVSKENNAFLYHANHAVEKFHGVLGETLKKDPEFAAATPKLTNCDYRLPENVDRNLAECIAIGSLLNPAVASTLKSGSSMVNNSIEDKQESLANDWLAKNDARWDKADSVFADIRNKIPSIFSDAADGNTFELTAAFRSAVQVYGKQKLHMDAVDYTGADNIYAGVMCDKLAAVIANNPYGIADGIPDNEKNAVLMKANLFRLEKIKAEAMQSLLTDPNLSREEKKRCLRQIVIVNTVQELQKKACKFPDLEPAQSAALKALGLKELPDGTFLKAAEIQEIFKKEYRFKNLTTVDLALANNPKALCDAIGEAISKDSVDRLLDTPTQFLVNRISEVDVNKRKIVLPDNPADPAREEENKQLLEEYTRIFKAEIPKEEKRLAKVQYDRELTSEALAKMRAEVYADEIAASLRRRDAGSFGASDEYKAVEAMFAKFSALSFKEPLEIAKKGALASQLAELGNAYLAKKTAKGITLETQGRSGDRFRNISEVVTKATRLSQISNFLYTKAIAQEEWSGKDLPAPEDYLSVNKLLPKLISAREKLDEADPFYYKSSPAFKGIQNTLNNCIEQLTRYGNQGTITQLAQTTVIWNLKNLEERTRNYTRDNANPLSIFGITRLEAVTNILTAVQGESVKMERRFRAREAEYQAILNNRNEKTEARRQKNLAEQERNRIYMEYHPKNEEWMAGYETDPLKSKDNDKGNIVSALASKVKLECRSLNPDSTQQLFYTNEIDKAKSVLVDRYIVDIIKKERAEHQDGIFEAFFIKYPDRVKHDLLEKKIVNKCMMEMINAQSEEDKFQAYTIQEQVVDKMLTKVRKFIKENNLVELPENDPQAGAAGADIPVQNLPQ